MIKSLKLSKFNALWFINVWVGMKVSKSWANECFQDNLLTILVTTRLWVHLCGSFSFDQMALLHFQKVSVDGKWVYGPLLKETLDL